MIERLCLSEYILIFYDLYQMLKLGSFSPDLIPAVKISVYNRHFWYS